MRTILDENVQLYMAQGVGTHHNHVMYKGVYHSFELREPRFKNIRLQPELHARMDAWLAEKKHIEYFEAPYIAGLFSKILNASHSLLDYIKLLPDCMHPCLDSFMAEPAYVLPAEMDDAQVDRFKQENHDLIHKLKRRMLLDLITV